ncbi:MAG: hypothetical protein A2026_09075 [Deltaproteobacteria bacterium RBG_19FT_COMBO_46_12]|nr:MAG: hypothetical protein A2026_09075 [Deltaproteobacteria bacterium RBG_19FT_COMBO_46_12]
MIFRDANFKEGFEVSLLMESDRFRGALVHTGPAFNTIPRIDRIGFIFLYFIDLAGTDLSAVSTTVAFFLIYERMHDLNPIFLAFFPK